MKLNMQPELPQRLLLFALAWGAAAIASAQCIQTRDVTGSTQYPASGAPPYDVGLVFDSARGVVVGVNLLTSDVYTYDGHSWSLVPPPAQQDLPPGNFSGALVYDAARAAALLLPASSATVFDAPLTGLYSLSAQGWKALNWTGPSPPPAFKAMGGFDPARGRTIFLISAGDTNANPWQTWEWTGSGWDQGPALNNAEPDSFTFDTVRGVGFLTATDPATGDQAVWKYTPGAAAAQGVWSSVPISGDIYQGLINAPLVFDPIRDRVIRCTGKYDSGLLGYIPQIVVWDWNQSTWIRTNLSYDLPDADSREAPGVAYDLNRDVMVLYGGFTYNIINGVGQSQEWTDTWEQQVLDLLYVDSSSTGTQDGSAAHPFATVHQAVVAISSCTRAISIETGNYSEAPLTINTPVLLQSRNGPATLH